MSRASDLNIGNQTMPNARAEFNVLIPALASNHLGEGQPSYIIGGMNYYENTSSTWLDRVYDGAADIEKGRVDTANNLYWSAANLIDSNGNEILEHVATTSAVNHVRITNAATGNGATISAAGGDTNIDLNITAKGTGGVKISGKFGTPKASEATIATGAITYAGAFMDVDTESDAASDDLATINGGFDGAQVVLRAAHADRTVVIKHNTGNILTQDGGDIVLDNTTKRVVAQYDNALSKWVVVAQPLDRGKVNALGSISGATAVDLNNGRVLTMSLTANATLSFSNWINSGIADAVELQVTNGGAYSLSFSGITVKYVGSAAPTLTDSGYDRYLLTSIDGGTNGDLLTIGQDIGAP